MHVVAVDDPADERLRDYVGLTDVVLRRLSEPEGGLYLAESTKVIERALAAGHRPRSVLLQAKWLDELSPLLAEHDAEVVERLREVRAEVEGFPEAPRGLVDAAGAEENFAAVRERFREVGTKL